MTSERSCTKSGVTHGSVLGPHLFSILFCDIASFFIEQSFLTLYANDKSAIVSSHTVNGYSQNGNRNIMRMVTFATS